MIGIWLTCCLQVEKGGHTFKTSAGRTSVAFQMKDNPFAKADRESAGDRGSVVTMEDLHRRAITIANPPQHEIIVCCHSSEQRERLWAVLRRFCEEEEEGAASLSADTETDSALPVPPPMATSGDMEK